MIDFTQNLVLFRIISNVNNMLIYLIRTAIYLISKKYIFIIASVLKDKNYTHNLDLTLNFHQFLIEIYKPTRTRSSYNTLGIFENEFLRGNML